MKGRDTPPTYLANWTMEEEMMSKNLKERVTVNMLVTGDEVMGTVTETWTNEETGRKWARVQLDDSSFTVPCLDLRYPESRKRPMKFGETTPGFVITRGL